MAFYANQLIIAMYLLNLSLVISYFKNLKDSVTVKVVNILARGTSRRIIIKKRHYNKLLLGRHYYVTLVLVVSNGQENIDEFLQGKYSDSRQSYLTTTGLLMAVEIIVITLNGGAVQKYAVWQRFNLCPDTTPRTS